MDQIALALLDGMNAVLVLMLVTVGLAIIFGLMKVINMAHGEFLMLGAYGMMALTELGAPFFVALLVAPLGVAALGALTEHFIIRRTYERLIDTILATWGVSLVLRQAMVLLYGPGSHAVAAPELGALLIFGRPYPVYRLFVMALSLAAVGGAGALFAFSRFGLASRAVIENRNMASCLGIDTRRMDLITFALGAGLAGLGGAAMAPLISIDPTAGIGWLVPGFLSVLVGGLGSLGGAVAGAAGIGALDSFTSALFSPIAAQLVVFALAIVVIRWRPNGLFAARKREA